MSNVLITGGSGLVGKKLSELLMSKGYSVGHLTRSVSQKSDNIKRFFWDVENGVIEEKAVPWADHIIHLAGETVGQRWSKSVKQKIFKSRVDSTLLLVENLKKNTHHLKSFLCASAIGYYGEDTGDKLLIEESPHGDGYLADVVSNWESAADTAVSFTDRIVKIRIGIVLSEEGGALAKMLLPIKWGVGSALGSGDQWMSWVHISDLCNMFLFALEKPLHGAFNGVGINPVTNKDFTRILARHLHRPLILPNVPASVLKLMLGEMSVLALGSNRVEPVAFLKEGFTFEFAKLGEALKSLI
ncbi:MAG: TIGR01777 family protein [Bacteroidetes bacterium]|nr:MAG: TIGR01777 family protein [Bacteroidota bacterium]